MEQINLNLIPGRAMPVCHVSQYDVDRTIRCNLFEGDTVFALATGDTAEVHVRKPDDTVVTASLTVVNAQTYLDIKTTQQMDAVAGSNLCEIQLTRSGATLGTLNFIMEVEADPMDGGAIGSQSEIRDLQAQVNDAVDVKMGTIEDELEDIRNGYQGRVYTSAGEAVRTQVVNVLDAVNEINGNKTEIELTDFSGTLSVNGATAAYDSGKIKLYGTCAAVRMLLCLNGQSYSAVSTTPFRQTIPAGTYQVHVKATGNLPADYPGARLTYTTTTFANRSYLYDGEIIKTDVPLMVALYIRAVNYGTVDNASYFEISITPYEEKVNLSEFKILSTGDTTDRTQEITDALSKFGKAMLGKGDFYVSGVNMPDNSLLCGCGESTRIILNNDAVGSAVILGDKCTLEDVSIYGDLNELTPDGYFAGSPNADPSAVNLWGEGDQSFTGYKQFALATPLPAGKYKFKATAVSSGTSLTVSAFNLYSGTTPSGDTNIANIQISRGSEQTAYFELTKAAKSVRLYAETTVSNSENDTATWSDIEIYAEASRCGVEWNGAGKRTAIVNNCRVYNFNCAGILLQDTMTPSDTHCLITNCVFQNCNVGVYIRRDSEFNKIANCTIIKNYFGTLNRGGNNYFSNCGFEKNKIGIQLDQDEGDNGGHGAISNCSVNHSDNNTGYGLIIRDTGREIVTNCNFYFSKIKLQHTDGNVLSNCGSGNNSGLEITDGYCNMLIGCMVKDTDNFPIVITNNNKTKLVNCYTRTGIELTI